MPNRLLIAGAGSGKTTYLVDQIGPGTRVLITTFTEENAKEIQRKIIAKFGCIPPHVTVQTWFSTLLQHGVRPFQTIVDPRLEGKRIGFFLTPQKSGFRYKGAQGPVYWGEADFFNYYFTPELRIYSDKISQFVCRANKESKGAVLHRLSAIFSHVFVDEVQDLAGYDLEIVKLLLGSPSQVLLVGDPRQATYSTHPAAKYKKYGDGKIADFVRAELSSKTPCEIDETTLGRSHRNPPEICAFAQRLFPDMPVTSACDCAGCNNRAAPVGVFAVTPNEVPHYLEKFSPLQLRWDSKRDVDERFEVKNMGEVKGLTVDRALIYPTSKMEEWCWDNAAELGDTARSKFYVALTRARLSAAVVMDCPNGEPPPGMKRFEIE